MLRGKCRNCTHPISVLYPFIEILTAVLLTALFVRIPMPYAASYCVFFSALIVTIRSDLETMLISRAVTIFLIPLGITLSALKLLPITLLDSLVGAAFGYLFLFSVSKLFFWLTKKEGIGQGDLELLAFIGSFIGIIGCWVSLVLGSIIGSIIGISYIVITRSSKAVKIPFGPFLAFGAIAYVLFQAPLQRLILGL